MDIKLLVSPLAVSAYFADTLDVCLAELGALFPGLAPQVERVGDLDFVAVAAEQDQLPALARLSFVQGLFENHGGCLLPLDQAAGFALPRDVVFGDKYRGKTNELVTQLAINLALRFGDVGKKPATLLDPMAGRGTTLMWALRYGLCARGIEQNRGAPDALHRHIKRQSKLHRIRHKLSRGFVGKRTRDGHGQFVQVLVGDATAQLITGDSGDAPTLLAGQRFDTLVTDLPYGVDHRGSGQKRNPLSDLRSCAPAWVDSVKPGGALVLIFNRYQPRRKHLVELFCGLGCHEQPFEAPHRMSEAIQRDLLVLTPPRKK